MGLGNQGQDAPHTTSPWARLAPLYGPAQLVQTQLPTRSAADSRHSDRMTTVDSDYDPGLPPGHQVAGVKSGPQQSFRRVSSFDHDLHDSSKSHPRPSTIKAISGSALRPRAKFDNLLLCISPKPRLGPRIPGSPNFSPLRCVSQLHPIPTHFFYFPSCRSLTSGLPPCSLILFLNPTLLPSFIP